MVCCLIKHIIHPPLSDRSLPPVCLEIEGGDILWPGSVYSLYFNRPFKQSVLKQFMTSSATVLKLIAGFNRFKKTNKQKKPHSIHEELMRRNTIDVVL